MKKVNVNRKFKSSYKKGEIKTKRLDSYDSISNEKNKKIDSMKDYPFKNFSAKKYILDCLNENRVSEFKKLWGKQDFIHNTDYRMYAWVVEHNGCEAIILSGKGRGTVVEIILDDSNQPKGYVVDFFNAYWSIMKDFSCISEIIE